MKMNLMSSIWLRAKRSTAAFVADCRAVAAVELAVIAPLMLLMFFATVEFSNGVAIDRKVTLVAHTLADLTSRSTSVTDTDLTNFFAAGTGIMYPYPASPINSTISELYVEPTTLVARVQWSTGAAPRAAKSTMTIPAALQGRRQLFDLQRGQLHIHAGGAVDPAGRNHAERLRLYAPAPVELRDVFADAHGLHSAVVSRCVIDPPHRKKRPHQWRGLSLLQNDFRRYGRRPHGKIAYPAARRLSAEDLPERRSATIS